MLHKFNRLLHFIFLGYINKDKVAISYLLNNKFYRIPKHEKKNFCCELLQGNYEKFDELHEKHSGTYDEPILEIISYALEKIYLVQNPLEIVNDALVKSNLPGLKLKSDDLCLSLFNGSALFFQFLFNYC